MKVAIKAILLCVAMTLAGGDVFAQMATLEEIVVTARKRSETLEESPVSVRAFTEAEIQSADINTPHDFI
ncbi:MAG TPA: hypothetical protein VF389_06845, partial [Woeseiaceae bacterium]